MYKFQLKVYDIGGQSSTAQVTVFVRRPATAEPQGTLHIETETSTHKLSICSPILNNRISYLTVNAGSDKVITLPLNWVILDGSKSRPVGDIVIHKWLWKQLQ